jgi:YD repeat-containing protein
MTMTAIRPHRELTCRSFSGYRPLTNLKTVSMAGDPGMGRLRSGPLATVLCAVWWSSAAFGAACSYTNFSIGFEISARQGPVGGKYLFAVSPLRCDGSGAIIYDAGTGFSDGHEMGWYSPSEIRNTLRTSFLSNMKAFEGWCRLHYIGINSRYHGTIAGIDADAYALQATPYLRVFQNELHLPLGDQPRGYRRDALAAQSTNICSPPAQSKGSQCTVANPIGPGLGCKLQTETDFAGAGSSPLEFIRYYDSKNPYHYMSALPRPLGNRWRHNHQVSLNAALGTDLVVMLRGDGRILYFHPKAGSASEWTGDANVVDRVSKTASGWTYQDADDALETFDSAGKRLTRALLDGQSLSFSYDAAGLLSEVKDHLDRRLQLTYDASGRLSALTDPAGRGVSYTYDAQGSLASVSYPDLTERRYTYTQIDVGGTVEPALLTGLTDEQVNPYASWTYDSSALASSSEHAGGVDRYEFKYQKDASGKITGSTVTNPLAAATQYGFTDILDSNKVSSISHPLLAGAAQTFSYDDHGNLKTATDFNGNQTTYTYELSRNLETRRVEAADQPEARTVSTLWHPVWRLPVKIAEPGKVTTYLYNSDRDGSQAVSCAPAGAVIAMGSGSQPIGVLCRKTEQATADANGGNGFSASRVGLPRTWNFTYSAIGQVLTADGPRTDVTDLTTFTYYPTDDADPTLRGRLATVTNALGHVAQVSAYDLNGNPLAVIDANGTPSTLTYDARQRLTSRTLGNEVTNYAYDDVGQLTRITLSDGSSMHYTYDPAHRLIAIADSLGNQTRYTLDALGNRTREDVLDPAAQLTQLRRRSFDALGRLAQDIGARDQLTAYAYDPNGNRSTFSDPLNNRTLFAYDGLNRLIQVTDPGLGQTRYRYDGQNRLIQVTDPRDLLTIYTVDGLGNRLQQDSPDTGQVTSTQDAAGNEVTRSDAKGQVSSFVYDALNRPTQATYHDGSQTRYLWDQGVNGIGRLTRIEDYQNNQLTGSVDSTYDPQGRLLSQTRSVGSVAHTARYVWAAGRLTGITTPSGRQISYTRDNAGRISEVRLTDSAPGGSGQTRVIAAKVSYHPFAGVSGYIDGAGHSHRRGIDQDGRIASYSLGDQSWLLNYDLAGRITAQFDVGNATRSVTYGYDAQDRLTSANPPNTSYGYTWDASSNRSSHTLGSSTRAYAIDPASNRLQTIASLPPRIYRYDANGSITNDGTNSFAYDGNGRLAQASTAAGVTAYQYNGLGERVRKTGSTNVVYHYDPAGRLLAESTPDGRITREYLWLEDLPLAVLQ